MNIRKPTFWILVAGGAALLVGVVLGGVRECGAESKQTVLRVSGAKRALGTLSDTIARGRVRDRDGKAVTGAQVELFCLNPLGMQPLGKARTDAEGRFSHPICNGGVLHAFVYAPGFARGHWVTPVEPPPGARTASPKSDQKLQRTRSMRILDLPALFLNPGYNAVGTVFAERSVEADTAADPSKKSEKPIAGALIVARPQSGPGRSGPVDHWPYYTRTDTDGRFTLEGLPEGRYDLQVAAKGYLPTVRRQVEVPGAQIAFVLTAVRPAAGTVTDGNKGVAGARVVVAGSGLWPPRVVETDAQGRFTLPPLPPGFYELHARKGDLASSVLQGVEITADEAPQNITLVLQQGVRVRVVVRDRSSGAAVAGARVTLSQATLSVAARRRMSDDMGIVELAGVLPGRYFVTVERQGYLATVAQKVDVRLEPPPQHPPAPTAGASTAGASTAGASTAGASTAGASTASASTASVTTAGASTADGGLGAAPAQKAAVDAGATDAKTVSTRGPLQIVEVRLRKGALLAGKVVDDLGNPVANARLEIISSARSVGAGRLSARVFESRHLFFQLEHDGMAKSSAATAPPAGAFPPALGTTAAGTTAAGTTAAGGLNLGVARLPGGSVSEDLQSQNARALSLGTTYRSLPGPVTGVSGSADATQSGGHGLMERGTANLGVLNTPLPLPPISGTWNAPPGSGVLQPNTLVPYGTSSTTPHETSGTHTTTGGSAWHLAKGTYLTDAQGAFRITGLPPGDAVVVIAHPDYARFQSRPLRLRLSTEKTNLRFALRPGITLKGWVGDPQKNPLAGVRVVVSGRSDAYHGTVAVSGEDGRFTLKNLWGEVRLEFFKRGYVSRVAFVDMSPKRESKKKQPARRMTFTIEAAKRKLAGWVVDKQDFPIAGASVEAVSLEPRAPGRAVATTNEKGEFTLEELGDLEYLVRVYHPDRPTAEFRNLALDKKHRLVVGFGGGISGWARDRQTRGFVRPLEVVLEPKVGGARTRTFADGRFEWTALPAGPYVLRLRAAGYAPLEKKIDIPAAQKPNQVTVDELHFWMDLAGRVEGVVRDLQALPIEGAKVWCTPATKAAGGKSAQRRRSGPAKRVVRSGEKGEFVLSDLSPGTCTLHAAHPDHGRVQVTGVVVERQRVTRDVIVELGGQATRAKAPQAGIKVSLNTRGEAVIISRVDPQSTAKKAGLAQNDRLISVDGETTEGLGLGDIRVRLSGPVGSTVVVEVYRSGRRLKIPVRRELLD